jgi:hypothetical protein
VSAFAGSRKNYNDGPTSSGSSRLNEHYNDKPRMMEDFGKPDYDGQIGHRYFDAGRYKADLICKIACDGFLIEHDMTSHYEAHLGEKQLEVGAVDVQSPKQASWWRTGLKLTDGVRLMSGSLPSGRNRQRSEP